MIRLKLRMVRLAPEAPIVRLHQPVSQYVQERGLAVANSRVNEQTTGRAHLLCRFLSYRSPGHDVLRPRQRRHAPQVVERAVSQEVQNFHHRRRRERLLVLEWIEVRKQSQGVRVVTGSRRRQRLADVTELVQADRHDLSISAHAVRRYPITFLPGDEERLSAKAGLLQENGRDVIILETVADEVTGAADLKISNEFIVPQRRLEVPPDVRFFVQDQLIQDVVFGNVADHSVQVYDRADRDPAGLLLMVAEARYVPALPLMEQFYGVIVVRGIDSQPGQPQQFFLTPGKLGDGERLVERIVEAYVRIFVDRVGQGRQVVRVGSDVQKPGELLSQLAPGRQIRTTDVLCHPRESRSEKQDRSPRIELGRKIRSYGGLDLDVAHVKVSIG